MQAAAEDIVAKLRARGFRVEAMQEEARKPKVATVDLDTLEHENPRTVGCERLCLKALNDLGFAEILHDLGIKGREARIATALIVARMVHPFSERETSRWLRHDSATAELLRLEGDRKALRRKTLYPISATCSGATGPPPSGSCSTASAHCFNRRFYVFNAFRSLLGIAGAAEAPTCAELYSGAGKHPTYSVCANRTGTVRRTYRIEGCTNADPTMVAIKIAKSAAHRGERQFRRSCADPNRSEILQAAPLLAFDRPFR